LLGAVFRLVGIQYGLPQHFVPDEQAQIGFALRIFGGDLNPHEYYYPHLQFYLLAAVLKLTSWVSHVDAVLVGRILALFMGLATILLTFLLARRVTGSWAAVIAGAFLAVSPLHVGYSHVALLDAPMAFWSTASLLALLRLDPSRPTTYILAGFLIGCAIGTKYNAVPLLAVLFLAHMVLSRFSPNMATPRRWQRILLSALLAIGAIVAMSGAIVANPFLIRELGSKWLVQTVTISPLTESLIRSIRSIAVSISLITIILLLASVVSQRFQTFLIGTFLSYPLQLGLLTAIAVLPLTSPYLLLDLKAFVRDFGSQSIIVFTGAHTVLPDGSKPSLLFYLNFLLRKELGPAIALCIAIALVRIWRERNRELVVVGSCMVLYILFMGYFALERERYILAALPPAYILAASGYQRIAEVVDAWCKRLLTIRRAWVRAGFLTIGTVALLAFPAAQTAHHLRIVHSVDTRTAALAWIEEAIAPERARIFSEPYTPELEISKRTYDIVHLERPDVDPEYASHPKLREKFSKEKENFVILSSMVYQRYFDHPLRAPREVSYYQEFDRSYQLIKVFKPEGGLVGPTIKIYKAMPSVSRFGRTR